MEQANQQLAAQNGAIATLEQLIADMEATDRGRGMTVYYVNGPGTTAMWAARLEPWKTIGRQLLRRDRGHGARCAEVYSEVVVIDTPDTTWMVDGDGSEPVVIDHAVPSPSIVFGNPGARQGLDHAGKWDAVIARKHTDVPGGVDHPRRLG